LIHGVAFLCGISTPSLSAQGEQRRLAYFNIDRDNAAARLQLQSMSFSVERFMMKSHVGACVPSPDRAAWDLSFAMH
jgi:hypothetical protein